MDPDPPYYKKITSVFLTKENALPNISRFLVDLIRPIKWSDVFLGKIPNKLISWKMNNNWQLIVRICDRLE